MTVWARALRLSQWDRLVCHCLGAHDLDWITEHTCGIRQCKRCRRTMPPVVPTNIVGELHVDQGD